MSPFQIVYGKQINMPIDVIVPVDDVPAACDVVSDFETMWEKVRSELTKS